MKPYADIRKALVEGIRNNPEKPNRVKNAAEVMISAIDANASPAVIQETYSHFKRMAGNEPIPAALSPAEIAKAFGLGEGGE